MELKCPIEKILLPVDGSEASKRAIDFTGFLGSCLGKGLNKVSILRVITGGYLSRHLAYIDFRAEELVKSSEIFKRIRDEYIEKNIEPLLDEVEMMLKKNGISAMIEKLIVDGDPANEIMRIADEGSFSTVILGRREGTNIGRVPNKVVHGLTKQVIYIVGTQGLKRESFRILIAVDGSSYSMKGVEHVACLSNLMKDYISEITLLRVINTAFLMERLKSGIDPEEEARGILNEGVDLLLKSGISEELLKTKVRIGLPFEEIIKESEEGNFDVVVMGRKGRSALKDFLIGGVSSTVLQRCYKPTVVIIGD